MADESALADQYQVLEELGSEYVLIFMLCLQLT